MRRLGPESRCLGPRAPLFPPGLVRGRPAGRALRTGEAPGRRSGKVSPRSCGEKEGPGRRGWRPTLSAGARWSACLPALPAGRAAGQEPSHARVWREWPFWFVYFRLWFCSCFGLFSIREEKTMCQPLPKDSLADGVFLPSLFVALLLFLVLFFSEISINIYHFLKKYVCFGKV